MNDEIRNVVAFWSGILGMAAGILVKTSAVDEKRIGGPAVRDKTLENVTEDLFHRKVNPAVRRENQSILVFKAEDTCSHTKRRGGGLISAYTAPPRSST
jgi:hypothetical protein